MAYKDAVRWQPLPREEVVKTIERRKPSRVPLAFAKWWGEGLHEQYGKRLQELDRFTEDTAFIHICPLDVNGMGLSWQARAGAGHDSNVVIDDWSKLDEFIDKLPDPDRDDEPFEIAAGMAEDCRKQDRYLLCGWWSLFFEKPWSLRGMENLLLDYYVEPECVHRLHDALADLYRRYIDRIARDVRPDGFWTSDDLGHQTQLMMSPEMFREMIKPYYERIGRLLRKHGIHFWLHSCGNNTDILGDLADAGVDVFHPVQKHTMDEVAVAREYGDRMTFLAGIDVQHALQEKDPDGVRQEVRFLIDTFDRPDGGMCLAAGNGIVSGTPFENIEAYLDEALRYGQEHRRRFA
ncbi:MAG: hypothetical protein JXQ73_30275 [Phycisphaerae bacterium]|nr:hypothetical protein [Phycisphaerae bacterium]